MEAVEVRRAGSGVNLLSGGGRRQILAVSDATGATAELVVRAALAQFPMAEVEFRRFPNVRTVADVRRAIEAAQSSGGIVVHTLVSEKLRQEVSREGRRREVITIDVMGSVLRCLTDLLAAQPLIQPGLFRRKEGEGLQRIEAIEYAVKHDDGEDPFGLDRADIILVGVSRTSKTPLSFYLAGKGWRVANIPVILNLPLPGPLMKIDQSHVVGLIIDGERLVELRRGRLEHPNAPLNGAYADVEHVRSELRYSRVLFRKAGWPVVDMTSRSIEEAATEILALTVPSGTPAATKPSRSRRIKAAKSAVSRRAPKIL